MYTPKGKQHQTEEKTMSNTTTERAINIMEAQNRSIQTFIEALQSGSITEQRYKELVKAALEKARTELAELN